MSNNSEKIEHQKFVADKVLEQLFPIDPFAICAGGAPRDWTFHNPATDIDIFFHSGMCTTIVERMLKSVGIDILERKDGDNIPEWYKLNPDLVCVFSMDVQGVPVQLMLMNKPTFKSVVPNFPFSICKAWYKNGKIKLDKEFTRSVRHKLIVKTGELYNDSHAYVKKIKAKFPEYKFYSSWERAAADIMDRE